MKFGERNVGKIDRAIRIVLGIMILGIGAIYIHQPVSYLFAVVGVILFGTGILGTCCLYSLLGINTAAKGTAKDDQKVE